MPAMAHEVIPVLSWQMAPQPLSESARETVIPGRQAMSDTHGELYFALYDARNRLVTGGAVIGLGQKPERVKLVVAERLQRLWPQIGPVEFDYVWNGYVGMTTDSFPRIHRLGRNAYGWTGCNGRAVALSIALGDELSKAARGVPEKHLALPFSDPAPTLPQGLLPRLGPLMRRLSRGRDAGEIAWGLRTRHHHADNGASRLLAKSLQIQARPHARCHRPTILLYWYPISQAGVRLE